MPHKAFLADQNHSVHPDKALREQRVWVGTDLRYCEAGRPKEFFDALDSALEDPRVCFVVAYPEQAVAKRAFMMEMRGYFRGWEDVRVAASRHVDLLDQLVAGGYIVLGKGVLVSSG